MRNRIPNMSDNAIEFIFWWCPFPIGHIKPKETLSPIDDKTLICQVKA